MKLIKEYLCDGTPSDEEIIKAIKIVEKDNCVVRLKWFIPYSGWYTLLVKDGMTFEECKNKLPRVYGL